MALIPCSECEREISDKAESCPHCGYVLRKLKPDDNPQKTEEEISNDTIGNAFALVLVLFVGLGIWFTTSGEDSSSESSSTSETRPAHSASGAWVMCQSFVENQLRSPGTAKFPWGYSNYVSKIGTRKYKVDSYVDAENAYGGTIRTEFECTISYVGNGRWELEDLKI